MNRRTLPFIAVGWSMMAFGVVGVLTAGSTVPAAAFGRWLVGLALVHDLVLVPIVLGVGVVVRGGVPAPWRPVVIRFLVVSAALVLVGWPLIAGWGRSKENLSIQPRDYVRGIVAAVVVTALFVAATAVAPLAYRRWRERSRRVSP